MLKLSDYNLFYVILYMLTFQSAFRFFSIDEQLACYCGFPRCRGVVNDMEEEERVAKLYVSRTDLVDWRGE